MYGYIRPHACKLSNADRDIYQKLYCGQCSAIHSQFGYLSRTSVSYDASSLGLLVLAQQGSCSTDDRCWCAVSPFRKQTFSEHELPQVISASFAVLLRYIKLVDSKQENPRSLSNVGYQLFRGKFAKASNILAALGFPKRYIDEALEGQRDIESNQGRSIDEYAAPTGIFLGRIFRFTAEISQCPENTDLLFNIGKQLGSLIYLVDSFVDLLEDINRDRFNGLIASYGKYPVTLEEAGRRELQEKSANYMLAVNAGLKDLVTVRYDGIVRNILSTGVPHYVSHMAQKELRKVGNQKIHGLSGVYHGLLGSLLCLASADAAAGQFVWGQEITDGIYRQPYTAYGYECHTSYREEDSPCNCGCCGTVSDAADCILNPFNCRIYHETANTSACFPACCQLPKAGVQLSVVGYGASMCFPIGGRLIRGLIQPIKNHKYKQARIEDAIRRGEAQLEEEKNQKKQEKTQTLRRLNSTLVLFNKESEELFKIINPTIQEIQDSIDSVEREFGKESIARFWKMIIPSARALRDVQRKITTIQDNAATYAINAATYRDKLSKTPDPDIKKAGLPRTLPKFSVAITDLPDLKPTIDQLNLLGQAYNLNGGTLVTHWGDQQWNDWTPSMNFPDMVRFGRLTLPSSDFPDLVLDFEIPRFAEFPTGRPLLMQVNSDQRPEAIGAIQTTLARLLATMPPGKLQFTFIDPVGLGQNVASFMPLADYDEKLVTSRSWSEPEHIDKRLKELTEHLENVIQKYLREEFQNIEDYNRQADEVAEAYRVLVILDFPVNFTETSARRLVSLVQNGPRCGVYPIILQDISKPLPYGFVAEDLIQSTLNIKYADGRFVWSEQPKDTLLELDTPCPPELLNRIIKEVGKAAKENMTVVVPYTKVLSLAGIDSEHPGGWWKESGSVDGEEVSTAEQVEIPLGPLGARKAQLLTLGKGTAHHALIAGRTGSGKSNLLHVIITTLALKYSPQEIELYLVLK